MKNNPLISVVTVSYNAVLTIEQTILSVINQTYPHIEYIIIDGGSTDGTVDIIKKYANRIAYWVSEPDKGIYDAMNKGIRTAKGEWINFMNAGDLFYSKDTLEKVFSKSINDNIKVIYGDVMLNKQGVLSQGKVYPISFMQIAMPFCHQSSFSHISEYTHCFNLQFKIGADFEFYYRIYHQYNDRVFLYMPINIAIYENVEGLSTIRIRECRKEWLIIRSDNKDIRWYYDYLKYFIKYKVLNIKRYK